MLGRSLMGLGLALGLGLPASGFENMNGEYIISKTPNAGTAECALHSASILML